MRCHLRKWYLRKERFFPFLIKVRPSLRDSAFSLRFPVENFRMVKFSTGKTLRKRRDGRKRDSEGENCDRRSACATRKRTVREPLFMPYPGMRPLSSPAVVKALLLPLHCICGLFCPYPRPPVLLLFRQPTILSLPCNPPQNQHRRINCMKTRARFLFPIPFPLLLQYHVLPFSFHILEYFSKHAEDRKTAWYFRFSPDRQ